MKTQDPADLGQVAVGLTWLWLATGVVVTAASLNTIRVLGGLGTPIADMPDLVAADRYGMIAAIAGMLASVVTGVVILRWIYVVDRNAHAYCGALSISPGWAVGWFFVPFANLFKPFQAMKEAWGVSVDPADPFATDPPVMMRLWWGAWLAASITGNLAFRLSLQARTPAQLIAANWVDVISLPLDVLLAVTLVRVIRALSRLQSRMLVEWRTGSEEPEADAAIVAA